MKKTTVYALFIFKFLFSLSLIWWTITMTLSSNVGKDDDNAFLSSYHDIDKNYNAMSVQNDAFNKKYNIKLILNGEIINKMDFTDIRLGQRSVALRTNNKLILKLGQNIFSYEIRDIKTNTIVKSKLKLLVTMTTNHLYDKSIEMNNDKPLASFNLTHQGYWNITGTVEVGTDKGYLFIKTNAR